MHTFYLSNIRHFYEKNQESFIYIYIYIYSVLRQIVVMSAWSVENRGVFSFKNI